MKAVYQASISCYGAFVRAASLFNPKAKLWVEGRKAQLPIIRSIKETWPVIWFHCASYGEFEQARIVIQNIQKSRPNHKILLTFFSPSGYEQVKNEDIADYIFYLPEENKNNIRLLLDCFPIELAVFVRYEFWYGYMDALYQSNIPLIFISASFRPSQIFFKAYGRWFVNQLQQVTRFFVQEQRSQQLLSEINIHQVEVIGDTRFDRVLKTLRQNESLPLVSKFTKGSSTLIFGSAWSQETKVFEQLVIKLPENWKVIFAPHEINHEELDALEKKLTVSSTRYSKKEKFDSQAKVLIVDTIGHLSRMYKYSDVAIIGGGFDDGIHNILEPMVFGLPVFFGPNHHSFWEAEKTIELGLNKQYSNFDELFLLLKGWFQNQNSMDEHHKKALEFIKSGAGASKSVTSYLLKQIK